MVYSDAADVRIRFIDFYTDVLNKSFMDLPITNHRLQVKIVGLQETDKFYSFCLITPWMMNSVVVPKQEPANTDQFEKMRLDHNEHLGKFYVTNIVSPMSKFKEMEGAIKSAEIHAKKLFEKIQGKEDSKINKISRRDFVQKLKPNTGS
jgi:[NiFe] hydrogenase assembly HybE family chaperone